MLIVFQRVPILSDFTLSRILARPIDDRMELIYAKEISESFFDNLSRFDGRSIKRAGQKSDKLGCSFYNLP
jgi:hypothetical protein